MSAMRVHAILQPIDERRPEQQLALRLERQGRWAEASAAWASLARDSSSHARTTYRAQQTRCAELARDRWNDQHPVGSAVWYRRSEAQQRLSAVQQDQPRAPQESARAGVTCSEAWLTQDNLVVVGIKGESAPLPVLRVESRNRDAR